MKRIETLFKGFEFYNREDNRCTIISKHFDSYECEEEEVDSPDGLAETVNKRTVFYTASEMRVMLHCSVLQWEDRDKWYAVMKDREDTDWGYGSYDLDEAIEMAKVYSPGSYIAVIDETGDPVCVDEIEVEE